MSDAQREASSIADLIAMQNPTDFGYPQLDSDSVILPVTSTATRGLAGKSSAISSLLSAYESARLPAALSEGAEADERVPLTSIDVERLLNAGALRFVAGDQTYRSTMDLGGELLAFARQDKFQDAEAWGAGPDPMTGRVAVAVGHLTPELAADLDERFGPSLVEVQIEGNPHAVPADSRTSDAAPYYGAALLTELHTETTERGNCSSAFAWESSGTYPLMTAGHCAPWGDDAVSTPPDDNMGEIDSGTRESWDAGVGSVPLTGHVNYIGDVALIRTHFGAESWARIWRGAVVTSSWSQVESVAPKAPYGDPYCFSGERTGETCGWEVTRKDWWVTYDSGEVAEPIVIGEKTSGTCTYFGDSGGAIFSRLNDGGVTAKGILSGINYKVRTGTSLTPCTNYWTDIHFPIDEFPGSVKLG